MHRSQGILLGLVAGLLGVVSMALPVPATAQSGRAIRCESIDGRFSRCAIPWNDAELARQESRGACVRNQSWGVDRQGLWVDRGCRGQFVEARRHGGGPGWNGRPPGHHGNQGGWRPGPDWDRPIRLACNSSKNRYQMCRVDVGRGGQVRLVRRTSDARCIEGRSWGWNRAGVWVDDGCRGEFVVDRRW